MAILIMTEQATPPSTPSSGDHAVWPSSVDNGLYSTGDDGLIHRLFPFHSATSASSAVINTVETVIGGGSAAGTKPIPANTLRVGSIVRITILGTNTSTVANATTFRVKLGALGTTGDTTVASAAVTSAAAGTNIPFKVMIEFTVRAIGASGSLIGSMTVVTTGVTGIAAVTNTVVELTPVAFSTTIDNYITVTHQTAASTTTSTFKNVNIEVLQ
jgi:hypothetical protein